MLIMTKSHNKDIEQIGQQSMPTTLLQLLYLTMLFIIGPCWLIAQTGDGIATEEIITYKYFKPILADAVKLNFLPDLPNFKTETKKFSYDIPKRLMELSYAPKNIKPTAIPASASQLVYKSYVRFGIGNRNLPFIELLHNNDNKRFNRLNFGASYKHMAAYAGKKTPNQSYSQNYLDLYGDYYYEKVTLSSKFEYHRDVVYFYGYDDSLFSFGKDSVKQHFNNLNFTASLYNKKANKANIDYDVLFKFNNLSDRSKNKEFNPYLKAVLSKELRAIDIDSSLGKIKHRVNVDLTIDLPNYTNSLGQKRKRALIGISPTYQLKLKENDFVITAGLHASIQVDSNSTFPLFPVILTEKRILKEKLIYYVGWTGHVQKNSFKTFTDENPFLATNFNLQNTRVQNRFTGFKGKIGKYFNYDINFAQNIFNELPLFINDTLDTKRFVVVYDPRAIVLNFHIALHYTKSEKLSITLFSDYFNYDLSQEAKAWHMPSFKLDLKALYNIANKIYLSGDVFIRDASFAKLSDGSSRKIKGLVDINFGLQYKYSKKLYLFFNLNNLAAVKYQRWNNYPSYGFNGILGFEYLFQQK